MSRITALEENIKQVRRFLEEDEERIVREPSNRFYAISRRSNEYDLHQLYAQLRKEKEKRYVEVLDLRFMGNGLDGGTIPLRLLSKISDFFSATILSSSNKYMFGRDSSQFRKDLVDLVDLRLAGMAFGSTRLIVTGNTAPDIFGYSILEEVFKNLFNVLDDRSMEEENINDLLHNFGKRGVRNLLSFLDLLLHDNIQIDITWNAPNNKELLWKGDYQKIFMLHKLLASSEIKEPEIKNISGRVKLLSESGRIVIERFEDGKSISIKFTHNMYAAVSHLTLGKLLVFECEVQKVFNKNTNRFSEFHTLITIKDLSDEKSN